MKEELQQVSINNQGVFVFTHNTTSMDLIEHVLSQTGPAELFVSSFSITEPAVRHFINLLEDKLITNLSCLFDNQVKMHHLQTLFFMSNYINDIYLTANHSKVILIKNPNFKISILSSANLNLNNKVEAGSIFNDPVIFDNLFSRYTDILNQSVKINRDDII